MFRSRWMKWSALLPCIGVVFLGVTAMADSGQTVRIAVVDGNGNLLVDAAVEWTFDDGTVIKASASNDGTFYVKDAGGKSRLVVSHPDIGAASTELALPAGAEVALVVRLTHGSAAALVVDNERFPTNANASVRIPSSNSTSDSVTGPPVLKNSATSIMDSLDYDRSAAVALQGGDTCATATVIAGLPATVTGTTTGFADDYNETCPFTNTGGLDVVYSFTPTQDLEVDISLCESAYDTKLYIYEGGCPGTLVACNDDSCSNTAGDPFRSFLSCVPLFADTEYFIIVDGYSAGEDGAYELLMTECIPPEPDCPVDSLFSQASDGDNAANSDENGGFRVFENYGGLVSAQICDVHWRGLNAFFDGFEFLECDRAPDVYEITFHSDAGGQPGAAQCTYQVTPNKTDTGETFAGFTVYQYSVDLDTCCFLQDGWVSIFGIGNPSCWGLWISSFEGDGDALQQDLGTGTFANTLYDMGICLTGEIIDVYGACCDDFTGGCEDCVLAVDCEDRFAAATSCDDLDPECGQAPGGCCLPNGDCQDLSSSSCAAAGGTFQGLFTVCPANPCLLCGIACPAGGIAEGEPLCGPNYDDVFNGGCNSDPPVFSDIVCGDTVCGESGTFLSGIDEFRDTDWYRFTVATDTQVTWTVDADFPVLVGIVDTGGVDDCAGVSDFLLLDSADACGTATVTGCIPAGTWYAFVSPSVFTGVDCGSTYTATLDCEDCPTGACCPGDGSCTETTEPACTGDWQGPGTSCTPNPCPQPSVNDECANALPLALGGSEFGNNEADNDDDTDFCGTSSPNQGIWYTVVGNGSTIKASTCNPGTDFDTKIQVWCDCDPTVCVGGNDDAPGGLPECDLDGLNRFSIVEWCSEPGKTYYIHVGGFGTAVGNFELTASDLGACDPPVDCTIPTGACCDAGSCVGTLTENECNAAGGDWNEGETCLEFSCPVPLTNDTCETSTNIPAVPYSQSVDTTNAGSDGPPSDCNSGGAPTMDNDVWWDYTPTEDCLLTITADHAYDAVGAIYSGPDCDNLTELTCYDEPDNPAVVQLSASAGTTYWIQIGDWGTADGGGLTDLDVDCSSLSATGACCFGDGTCTDVNIADCGAAGGDYQGDGVPCNPCPQPPANDLCEDAETLGAGGTANSNNAAANDDPDADVFCGTASINQPVWYEIIGTGNELTVSTCNPGTDYDTKVKVFCQGCDTLACVGGNDDASGAPPECALGGLNRKSSVTFCSESGISYLVVVGGFGSTFGNAELTVTEGAACGSPPSCGGAPSYCATCWTNDTDDAITNVTFNTIDNDTGFEGDPCSYGDYTAQSTTVSQNDTHNLSVTFSSLGFTEHVWAWIDWNQDFDFDDAGEAYDLGAGADTTLSAAILIPTGAALGDTRMRVTERWNTDPGPCDSVTFGETEDYTITVVARSAISGGPTCGDGCCIEPEENEANCCTDCPCTEGCEECNPVTNVCETVCDVCEHCELTCTVGRSCFYECVSNCGDGTCDPACENCFTCEDDCGCGVCTTCNTATGICDPDCGNGVCQPLCLENCRNCFGDCGCDDCDECTIGGSCVSACGDGTCDPACETCSNCPEDCHECGDGCCTASAGESCCSCSQDCGPCCGNGVCDGLCGEDCSTCPSDCEPPEGEECMPTMSEWGLVALVLLLLTGLAIKFGQYRRQTR